VIALLVRPPDPAQIHLLGVNLMTDTVQDFDKDNEPQAKSTLFNQLDAEPAGIMMLALSPGRSWSVIFSANAIPPVSVIECALLHRMPARAQASVTAC
jgi:hypothetical protein